MMFKWLGEKRGYERLKRAWRGIDGAVDRVLSEGRVRTPDLKGASGAQQFGDAVVQALLSIES
jgi:isocitrate/isopropylmalate dehydrogenase